MDQEIFSAEEKELDALAEQLGGRWFPAKVIGVTFLNEDGSGRQQLIEDANEGDEWELVPEPENEHDPHAVRVEDVWGNRVGYVDRRLAHEHTDWLKCGKSVRCFLKQKTGGDGAKWGAVLAVLIWTPE